MYALQGVRSVIPTAEIVGNSGGNVMIALQRNRCVLFCAMCVNCVCAALVNSPSISVGCSACPLERNLVSRGCVLVRLFTLVLVFSAFKEWSLSHSTLEEVFLKTCVPSSKCAV